MTFETVETLVTWKDYQLGEYARTLWNKTAETGWHLGVTLWLAKLQVKKARNGWGKWCKQYIPHMSTSTIWRYMRLAKGYDSPDKLKGISLTEALDAVLVNEPSDPEKDGEGNGKGNRNQPKNVKPHNNTPPNVPPEKSANPNHVAVTALEGLIDGATDKVEALLKLSATERKEALGEELPGRLTTLVVQLQKLLE